jgi:cell division protein FtsB
MNDLLTRLIGRVPPVLRNRYLITTVVFVVWLIFFDNNNLVERYRDIADLKQLKRDREYFTNRIEEDTRKLNELKTSNENLEKFAREEYLMKKDNEEIFIVVTEKEEKKNRARGRKRFLIFQEP